MLRNSSEFHRGIYSNSQRRRNSVNEYLNQQEVQSRKKHDIRETLCNCKPKQLKVFDWIPFRKHESLSPKLLGFNRSARRRDEVVECNNCKTTNRGISHLIPRRLPGSLQSQEFDFQGMDKIFSAVWLNNEHVVVGTKCQKLVILNVKTNAKIFIPLFEDYLRDSMEIIPHSTGIHSVAINPSRTLLAVGAGKPNESIQIFRLPTFELVGMLQGHCDMVFSVNWLDDNTLASGSRDKALKIWSLSPSYHKETISYPLLPDIQTFSPAMSKIEHDEKVRDTIVNKNTKLLFTLSADGTVKLWDSVAGTVKSTVPLFHTNETVCMGLDPMDHLVSIGSQGHISMIDSRISKIVHTFESLDDGWGVRSLYSHQNLLTIGGGMGRVSFYDIRAEKYLAWDTNQGLSLSALESGKGWIDKDAIYNRHFQGMRVRNAVYTIAYDQDNSRLFTAGGPLQLNLRGSYVGLWN